LKAHMPRPISH